MVLAAVLLGCMAAGFLGRRSGRFPEWVPKALNAAVVWVCLPALALRSVHGAELSPRLVAPVVGLWLCFGVAALLAVVAVRRGVDRGVAGALALSAGLGNTAFVGLPLLNALGGAETAGPAVVMDQLGSFFALALMAVPLAAWLSGGRTTLGGVIVRTLRFPPFVALVVGLLLRPVTLPGWFDAGLSGLGMLLSPLALLSVGWMVDLSALAGHGRHIAWGLGWKLLGAPLVMCAVVALTAPGLGSVERIAVAQAAMGPMVTGGVLAAEHGLAPKLSAGLIAVGLPLSLLTASLWWWLLGALS